MINYKVNYEILQVFLKNQGIKIENSVLYKNESQKSAVMCYAKNEFNEYLLLKRIKEPFSGFLVPPGGKTENNESVEEAMKREYMEETGLELDNIKLSCITTENGPENYNWILFIFTADIKKSELPACNEGELVWIEESSLKNQNLSEIDKMIYDFVFSENRYFVDISYDSDKNPKINRSEIV